MLNQRVALNYGEEETKDRAKELMAGFTANRIKDLYEKYARNPKIKWKEFIKKGVGLDLPDQVGLDIDPDRLRPLTNWIRSHMRLPFR